MILSEGEVRISNKSGESMTLRCTPRAAKDVNAAFGSFMEALRRVETIDYAACNAIVTAGSGKPRAEVENFVFDVGIANMVAPLSRYVVLLVNGGRDPSVTDGSTEGQNTGEA